MSFKKEWYESLLTVTSVLLKHRQNPLSTIPFRTYPLYSLISHIPASNFGQSSTYMTACMVVLLNAQVDPNFNEVEYETRYEAFNIQTAFGRSAFPSSLHCLYGNVLNLIRHFDEDTTSVRRFVTKATETLLRHGAEPNVIGPIEDTRLHGNALHAFMKICISLGLDERSITTFRLLIQNGSDPNVETTGIFPLNTFVEEILVNCDKFEKLSKHDEVSITEYVSEVLTTLLDSMLQRSISSSLKYKIDGKPSNAIQRKLYKMCRDEMSKRSLCVDSLTKLCRLQILSSCKWRSTLVVQLPIPVALKKYLNNIT
ncbi:hypothetical protein DPMN_055467 [Dreissena polymorpha]|uniref:SOCS box domain-containing protein n=1 Tax=Dreissena polymorpha TaxID=45954 RepID=A0A9D4CQ15_DREPO|nr:hypothetical protein DPMN_055467 [Dreissena polymorpha]